MSKELEEAFMSMDDFNDSPIFDGDGSNNTVDIIDNSTGLSAEEAEARFKAFMGETEDTPTNEDDKNNITVEDEENPEDVGSEEDVDDDGGNEDDDSDSSSNLYSSLAGVIHEQGLLPSVDITKEEIKTVDDLTRILSQEQDAQALKRYNEYITNLDVEKIAGPLKQTRELESVDADYLKENIEYAKQLIRNDYLSQGFDEDKTNRIINRLVDLGDEDLIDEALKAKESIVEQQSKIIEEEKQRQFKQREEAEREAVKAQEAIKKRVFEQDIVEGFKPTKAFREKMYNTMTTVIGEDPNGNPENAFMRARREDVVGFETRMYAFFELTNGFTDFSKLVNMSKSKAVSELEKAARASISNNNSTPAYVADKNSYFGAGDFTLNI